MDISSAFILVSLCAALGAALLAMVWSMNQW